MTRDCLCHLTGMERLECSLAGDSWACGPGLAAMWVFRLGILGPSLTSAMCGVGMPEPGWVIQSGLYCCQQAIWPGQEFIGVKEFEKLKGKKEYS